MAIHFLVKPKDPFRNCHLVSYWSTSHDITSWMETDLISDWLTGYDIVSLLELFLISLQDYDIASLLGLFFISFLDCILIWTVSLMLYPCWKHLWLVCRNMTSWPDDFKCLSIFKYDETYLDFLVTSAFTKSWHQLSIKSYVKNISKSNDLWSNAG